MGGARVEARSRNVVIEVKWQAATYSGSDGKTLKGKNLSFGDARKAAVKIIKHLLAEMQ